MRILIASLVLLSSGCRSCFAQEMEVASLGAYFPLASDFALDATPTMRQRDVQLEPIERLTLATVRVTTRARCGSGSKIGEKDGNAVILTNAHVAGTQVGKTVTVEHWSELGVYEKGTATIAAAALQSGTSLDWAILFANDGFLSDAPAIPLSLSERPDERLPAYTSGCPRCEMPSIHFVRWEDTSSNIYKWSPNAISGRSGSGVFQLSEDGTLDQQSLLTWSDGRYGMGQRSVDVWQQVRGDLPATIARVPTGVLPVATDDVDASTEKPKNAKPVDVPEVVQDANQWMDFVLKAAELLAAIIAAFACKAGYDKLQSKRGESTEPTEDQKKLFD